MFCFFKKSSINEGQFFFFFFFESTPESNSGLQKVVEQFSILHFKSEFWNISGLERID